MLLFLRNFVSVCSQRVPKCNKPDNRHNFTTTTNLTAGRSWKADQLMKNVVHDLSELRKILQRFETVFVSLFVWEPRQNVQFVNLY